MGRMVQEGFADRALSSSCLFTDYGQEFEDLLRSGLPRSAIEMEIQRIATETLMSDPRTASVDDFVYEWSGDSCHFSCFVSNVHDETAEIQGMAVNV